jgi:hypothetical protein
MNGTRWPTEDAQTLSEERGKDGKAALFVIVLVLENGLMDEAGSS